MVAALPLNGYIVLASSLTHKIGRKEAMGGRRKKNKTNKRKSGWREIKRCRKREGESKMGREQEK